MNEAFSVGSLAKYLLILLLGTQSPEKPATQDESLQAYVSHESPLYAELNLTEFRAVSARLPGLREAALPGGASDATLTTAAKELGQHLKLRPATITRLFEGTHRIGMWFFGFSLDAEVPRLLMVVDRLPGDPILTDLIPEQLRNNPEVYMKTSYSGVVCHSIGGDEFMIWACELGNRLVIGTDMMSVHSFILQVSDPSFKPVKTPAHLKGAILHADVNAPQMLNLVLSAIDSYDMEEFGIVSMLFDLPAWQRIRLVVRGDSSVIIADMASRSPLLALLQPRQLPSELLKCLEPETEAALVFSPKSPMAIWKHVAMVFDYLGSVEGEPQMRRQFMNEIQEEIGVDLEKDVIANVTAAGLAYPTLPMRMNHLDDIFAILVEAKDPVKAEQVITRVASAAGGEPVSPVTTGTMKTWTVDRDVKFGMIGKTIAIGPVSSMGDPAEELLKTRTKDKLTIEPAVMKKYSNAVAWLVLNPSRLLRGVDTGQITAALTVNRNIIGLTVDYDLERIAASFSAKAKQDRSLNNLRLLARACGKYMSDYGRYPPALKGLLPYAGNNARLLVCPVSGKPYLYNKTLVGMTVGTVENRSKTVLAYDATDAHADGGCVVFLDGHALLMNKTAYEKILKTVK